MTERDVAEVREEAREWASSLVPGAMYLGVWDEADRRYGDCPEWRLFCEAAEEFLPDVIIVGVDGVILEAWSAT